MRIASYYHLVMGKLTIQHYILSVRHYNSTLYKLLLTQMAVMLSASLVYVDYFHYHKCIMPRSTTVENVSYVFVKEYAIL